MRVVLIVLAVLIGLIGLPSVLGGITMLMAGGLGGLFGSAFSLAFGGALLYAAWRILNSQLDGGASEDAEERARRARAGLRIALIVLALFVGVVGLLFSLCGVIFSTPSGNNGAGWFIAIGVVLVVVAIILAVKARGMRSE